MSLRGMIALAAGLGLLGIGTHGIGSLRAQGAEPLPPPSTASSTTPTASSQPKLEVASAARSAKELRLAVVEAMRRADSAKEKDRVGAAKSLVDVYGDLGRDVLLPAKERLRLGAQVRARLQRLANQFRYELAHGSTAANSRGNLPSNSIAANSQSGAAGPAASEGLDSLVELVQSTIGQTDDWVARQPNGMQQGNNGPAMAGGAGVGFGGAGAARGGAFGNAAALQKGTDANGADLVDLIQKTIDPPSWDINGGPGSILYFNNLRVLVVSQTAENQDDVGGLIGGLRK